MGRPGVWRSGGAGDTGRHARGQRQAVATGEGRVQEAATVRSLLALAFGSAAVESVPTGSFSAAVESVPTGPLSAAVGGV